MVQCDNFWPIPSIFCTNKSSHSEFPCAVPSLVTPMTPNECHICKRIQHPQRMHLFHRSEFAPSKWISLCMCNSPYNDKGTISGENMRQSDVLVANLPMGHYVNEIYNSYSTRKAAANAAKSHTIGFTRRQRTRRQWGIVTHTAVGTHPPNVSDFLVPQGARDDLQITSCTWGLQHLKGIQFCQEMFLFVVWCYKKNHINCYEFFIR